MLLYEPRFFGTSTYLLRFETKILLISLNIVVYQAWFLVLTCVAFIWQSAFYLLPLRVLFGPWFYKSDWWWFYKGRGFWIFTPVGFNQTEVFTKLPVAFLLPPGLQSGREEYQFTYIEWLLIFVGELQSFEAFE